MVASNDSMTDLYDNSNTMGEFDQSRDTLTLKSQLESDIRSNSPVKFSKKGNKLDFENVDDEYQ